MSAVVSARGLGRWYGQVVGLSDLTVELPPGITGLLGPNGAGKSTFLQLVVGMLRPGRGAIEVLGERPFANRRLYARLGFAPQQDALHDDLTAVEEVGFLMRLAGLGAREAMSRAEAALERVGLTDVAGRRIRTFSKGMRQRVKLAQAIGHGPELLVLDEPLTGLDPVGRHEVIALLQGLAGEGVHVVASSHVLHEIEALTHEIVLLHRGRLLARGSIADVRALLSQHPSHIEVAAADPRGLARALLERDLVVAVRLGDDGRLSLETRDREGFLARLTALGAEGGFGIRRLETADESLEAVFDYLVQ